MVEGSAEGYRVEVLTEGGRRVEVGEREVVAVRREERVVIRVSPREG